MESGRELWRRERHPPVAAMNHRLFLPLGALTGAALGATAWVAPTVVRAETGAAQPTAAGPSTAEQAAAESSVPREIAEVVVSADAEPGLSLDSRLHTGSSLGLTARETPATVDVITQRQMQDIGARTSEEALNRAPGVTASINATSPGALSLRGFTGSGRAVLLLYDGVRPVEESLFTRVIDSWMFERIEVLKGPSSVDYGEGALAGVINLVPKHARLDQTAFSGQLGYGSFGSFRAAADANVILGDRLAVRPVVSYHRASGYVDDTSSEYLAGTLGVAWAPSDALVVDLALDYLRDDHDTAYFGTPLVPPAVALEPSSLVTSSDGRVLDGRLREVNYNVVDGITDSNTGWLRAGLRWQLGGGWSLSNDLHLYTSDRRFLNSEYFGYNSESGLIDRSTGIVTHDLDYWIDRALLRGDVDIAGLRNRMVVGASFSDVDFFTERRFGSTTSVDSRNPERGLFPAGDDPTIFPRREDRQNSVSVASVFAENALSLTGGWLVLGGVRFDHIDVDRVSTDLNLEPPAPAPIERRFDEVTWRVGSVADVLSDTQLFAQYSTAAAPPSSLVTLTSANASLEMTRGWALEGGVKSSPFDGRIELTAAAFYILQKDIVTRSPTDPTVSLQNGQQSSRGIELSVCASLFDRLRLLLNYTYFDARFDALIDDSGNDLAGHTPERVPERLLNAFVFFETPVLPLTASVGVHSSGGYFTDNANSIKVGGFTTFEAALRYRLELGSAVTDITLRGRNLTDALHASYTDISPDQLTLAPPRSVDLMATVNF
jgi:iron complex outermembrane recepter protein